MSGNQKDRLATSVTPVLLTYNEIENIGRTLSHLYWADRVVVVDSGSNDGTEHVARSFPNVVFYVRKFDSHGAQWNYAIRETDIQTPFVLALDADMCVTRPFRSEILESFLANGYDEGTLCFRMVVAGVTLNGGLYPSQLRLFRPSAVKVEQRGHTQVFSGTGSHPYRFRAPVLHDDRKPVARWVSSQLKYVELELERIQRSENNSFKDTLRKFGVAPFVAGALAFTLSGGPFKLPGSVRYALERATFESLLAIRLSEMRSNSAKEEQAP